MYGRLSRKLVLRILVPSAAVLAIGLCIAVYSKSSKTYLMQAEQQSEASPTQVVRTYWKLALEGNIEQTVSYETNTDGKIVALESAETGSWAEIIHQKGLVLLDTRDEIINGDKAQLVAEVRYPNGKINTLQHNLHKESGKWKILTVYSVDPLTCKYLPEMCNFVEMPNTGGVGHK